MLPPLFADVDLDARCDFRRSTVPESLLEPRCYIRISSLLQYLFLTSDG